MAEHDHLEIDTDDAVGTDVEHHALVSLVAAGAGMAATFVANQLIRQIWKAVTGDSAPKNANDPSLKIVQAVAFAALSAGVAVLARRAATHGAKQVLQAMK